MSADTAVNLDADDPEEEALEYVREHYDAYADLATSTLPIAEDCQRIIDWYHDNTDGGVPRE